MREDQENIGMIQSMRNTRKLVIRKLMMRAQDDKVDVNDIIRAIKAFDNEAINAFEAVARWQEVCIHFDDNPFKPYLSVEQRSDLP